MPIAIARSVGPTRSPHSSGIATAMPASGRITAVRLTLRSRRVMDCSVRHIQRRFLLVQRGRSCNICSVKTSSALSPAAIEALRPELPALADEIVAALRREVPEYARPLRGDFGRGIRIGVEEALRRFGSPASDEASEVYRALGRGELREGRSLDALQSAYRVGARVAWRRLSRAAQAAGVPVAEQHALAEAIFAYIDQIAADSVEGYAAAQAALAGDRQRHREALLGLLTGRVPAEGAALAVAAADADWRVPRRVAVIAC